MSKGIAYALAACLIWGLIFIVPQFMTSFSPIEIATGRYLVYGMISLIILISSRARYSFKLWKRAFLFSVLYSFGYYVFVVLSVRYATPAICALILGISPIAIAYYGNWRKRECTNKSLFLPSFLILIGLLLVNLPHIMTTAAPSTFLTGLLCAACAMGIWSWYVVDNSDFLKRAEIQSSDWSTLIGVATLFWVAVFIISARLFSEGEFNVIKFTTLGPELTAFMAGSAILGIMCSWVGCFLWNKASLYLPVSLAGQLTIFETIFGLCFVYMLEQRIPPALELLGVISMLSAIVYGIRSQSALAIN